jgi:predicted nucleotidyltransferase
MNADQIIERIRGLRARLDDLDVASLGLFGSVARGEERDDSDVDILVAFRSPATFDQYMEVTLLLEDALGRRVDLVTERGLRKALRLTVERELRRVA